MSSISLKHCHSLEFSLPNFKTAYQKTTNFLFKAFNKTEHVWSYSGKLILISRHIMNAAVRSGRVVALAGDRVSARTRNTANYLKFFSIVGVPFTLVSIKNGMVKMYDQVRSKDVQGIALNALSLTLMSADAVDSTTTFINISLIAAKLPPVAFFQVLGLPLGFAMSSVGSVIRVANIAKTSLFYNRLNRDVVSKKDAVQMQAALKDFLAVRLEITDKERVKIETKFAGNPQKIQKEIDCLQKRKKADLLRSSTAEAVKTMEKLHHELNLNGQPPKDLKEILESLDDMKSCLNKKLTLDVMGLVANLFILSALILFTIGNATAVPFILLAISIVTRLSTVVIQDVNFKHCMNVITQKLRRCSRSSV